MKNTFFFLFFSFFMLSPLFSQTFWTGDFTSFTKAPNADWNIESSQDRITSNVWLTRKNTQSIFNITAETGYGGSAISPSGTEWAYGQISDDVTTLSFLPFVQLMGGAGDLTTNILNNALVLHLITDDIYIDIEFNQWSQGSTAGGGFSYRRSTPNTANVNQASIVVLNIFPNPAKDFIKISGVKKEGVFTITNMLGSIVKKGNLKKEGTIDISKLKKGIYFFEFENEVLKFVKN